MLEEFDHFFNDSRQQKRLTFLMESFEHMPYNRQKDAIKEIVSVAKQVNYDWCDMFGLGDTGLKYFTKDSSVFTEFVQYLDPNDLAIYNEYRENTLSSLRAKENMIDNDQLSINEYFSDIHNSIVDGVPTYASEQITTESVVDDMMVKLKRLPKYLYFGSHSHSSKIKLRIAEIKIDKSVHEIIVPPAGLPTSQYKAIASIFGIDHRKITGRLNDHFAIIKYKVEDLLESEKDNKKQLNRIKTDIFATVYHTGKKRRYVQLCNDKACMYAIPTADQSLKGKVYQNTGSPLKTLYVKDVPRVKYDNCEDFRVSMRLTYCSKDEYKEDTCDD